MPATVTLTQLRTRVRFMGDFENSRIISDARIDEIINVNLRRIWDLLLDHRVTPYVKLQTGSPATVANTATVALANDFYRLHQVLINVSGLYTPLHEVNLLEAWRYQQGLQPYGLRYTVRDNNLVFFPTPTAVYPLQIQYYPTMTALSSGSDTFNFVSGSDDLLVTRCVYDLKMREQMPAAEWLQRADMRQQELIDSISELNAGEPFLLSGGVDTYYGDGWGAWGAW